MEKKQWLDIGIYTYYLLCVFVFIFMFRNNVVREQLGQHNFHRCYVFFLKSIIPKVLDHNDAKILDQQLRSTLKTAVERHVTTKDFMDIGVKPARRHLTYYCMLLFLSNKPSF